MDERLKDKVVVVTGGAGLLGRAFAESIAKNCGTCIIADIDKDSGRMTRDRINAKYGSGRADFVSMDINNLDSISEVIYDSASKYKRIDALVNNAYPRNKNYGRRFEDVTYKDFCQNCNMHLGGYFLTAQQFAKYMVKQGRGNIVNIASIYGFVAPKFDIYEGTEMTMPVEYSAIKGGVINLTRYLASYFGDNNICVNSISPGGIFDNQPEGFVKRYSESAVLGKRMATTQDMTGALVFLLSDDSRYITGENIVVDGGWSLQ